MREMLDLPEKMIKMAALVLRIRDKEGYCRALKANAAQRAFERNRGRANIVLKARQMGISTWVAGRFLLRSALTEGGTTLLVAHNQQAAEMLFSNVRRMWEELPEEIRCDAFRLSRCNVAEMAFAVSGGEFRVASAADVNAGRGMSLSNLHCSEVSRWGGDARATLAGLRAALAPGGELVLESTPSGAHGVFYEEWKAAQWPEDAEVGTDGLVRHFFPWWTEPSYKGRPVSRAAMSEEEAALVERHGLSGAQIGFRRALAASYGALRGQEFAEDPETCFRATGACCFELDTVERCLESAPEPVRRSRNGALWEWLPPQAGREYLLAVDTAGGGAEGDYAAVQVIDMGTGVQCAELQERLRPAALAEVCAELAARYGDALVAVERNNHGAAVLALLQLRPEVRLYRQRGECGWLTSMASKPGMVARLGSVLEQKGSLLRSRRLLAECRTFVLDERGRAGAAGGAHDDLVMAMALGQAVRAEVVAGNHVGRPTVIC